jgi:hypothetical protein
MAHPALEVIAGARPQVGLARETVCVRTYVVSATYAETRL